MKSFLNILAILPFIFAQIVNTANAQQFLNPAAHHFVERSIDTLYFRSLDDQHLLFKTSIRKGSASHFMKFSPSGALLITSGDGPITNLYRVNKHFIHLIHSLPVLTEEAAFDLGGEKLYLLHTKMASKTKISSYSTKTFNELKNISLSCLAHDLTLNSNGKLLGFIGAGNLHTLGTSNMKNQQFIWKGPPIKLLVFNPIVENRLATVTIANNIQILDIKSDSLITEIDVHSPQIVWLGFDPSGRLLSSLDSDGLLSTWMPGQQKFSSQLMGVSGIPTYAPDGILNLSLKNKDIMPSFVGDHKIRIPNPPSLNGK